MSQVFYKVLLFSLVLIQVTGLAHAQILITPGTTNENEVGNSYEEELKRLSTERKKNRKKKKTSEPQSGVSPSVRVQVEPAPNLQQTELVRESAPQVQAAPPVKKVNTGFAPVAERSAPLSRGRVVKSDGLILGLSAGSYKYEEKDFVTHTGYMYGAWIQYITPFGVGALNLQSSLVYGQLTYEGSNQSGPLVADQTDYIIKPKVRWQFSANQAKTFNIRAGLGYRYLNDSYGDQASVGLYTRMGSWIFLPIGMSLQHPISPDVSLSFDLEYQHVLQGSIKSFLSELNSSNEDVVLNQTGSGLELNAGIVYNRVFHILAYYDSWNLNESGRIETNLFGSPTILYEPANTAVQYGIKIGYDFF